MMNQPDLRIAGEKIHSLLVNLLISTSDGVLDPVREMVMSVPTLNFTVTISTNCSGIKIHPKLGLVDELKKAMLGPEHEVYKAILNTAEPDLTLVKIYFFA